MVCRLITVAGLLALAGCAQEGDSRPSYLGLSDLAAGGARAESEPAPANLPSESLRHVQSNKVLGAMAFQKVTGRAVDPDSLSGREQP
jgi:hypothetical protein